MTIDVNGVGFTVLDGESAHARGCDSEGIDGVDFVDGLGYVFQAYVQCFGPRGAVWRAMWTAVHPDHPGASYSADSAENAASNHELYVRCVREGRTPTFDEMKACLP